jgi:maltoporin
MRVLRVITATFFACLMAAGVAFAADDPLEIHGGGRVGIDVNGNGGGAGINGVGASNEEGSMPGYGQTRYWALNISKKVKADDGSWAKVSTTIDKWLGTTATDLTDQTFRFREFQVQFGGLDFLPKDAVLWGGLRGYGAGWNGQQDHGFIDFNGIGFGVEKLIAGVVSLAYMKQDKDPAESVQGLGNRTLHNFIANVNVPVADVYAAYGYSPKGTATGEKPLSDIYVGGIFHAPVAGLNVGADFATNGYAYEIYNGNSDTALKGDHFSGVAADKLQKFTGATATAWTVTDIMPGLYIAPAIRYDYLVVGKDVLYYGTTTKTALGKSNTLNKLGASFRLSKSLTKNLSLVPTLGYYREWDKEKAIDAKPFQQFEETLALEVALNQGFGANQKLQFYGTFLQNDTDHKGSTLGAGYGKSAHAFVAGMLVTFGF